MGASFSSSSMELAPMELAPLGRSDQHRRPRPASVTLA